MQTRGRFFMGMLVGATALLGLFGLKRRFGRAGGSCSSGGWSKCGGRWGHGGWSGSDGSSWRERAKGFASRFLERAFEHLQATPEQRQRIQSIFDRLWTGATGLQDEKQALREELRGEWKSEAPDGTKVHASLDARIESLRRFAHDAADAVLEIHRLLTPEQRAKVNSWMDARRHGHC